MSSVPHETPQLRTHKVRLVPNSAALEYFTKAVGTARFAYNWGLAEWQRQYAAWKIDPTLPKPSEMALRKQLNAIKRTEFPWMLDVTKCAPQEALIALGVAYKNWFSSLSGKRKGPKVKAPTFKKKGRSRDSFKLSSGQFAVDGDRLRVAGLGWVRMREALRFTGRPVSVTISRTADAWFAAITVETTETVERTRSTVAVGVDLGVKTLATLSDGQAITGPKALGALLARLRRLSRQHSRKQKGSSNRKKAALRLARLQARIANVRNDALHKLTHRLTTEYGYVAIEDLNVAGMVKNHALARHISDASFGEFRRQLEYKAALRGVVVGVVDRFFASSKICHDCGLVNSTLSLSDRRWTCECGAEHDRDLTAAKNILAESLKEHAAGSVV